jgi:hypothetical protein
MSLIWLELELPLNLLLPAAVRVSQKACHLLTLRHPLARKYRLDLGVLEGNQFSNMHFQCEQLATSAQRHNQGSDKGSSSSSLNIASAKEETWKQARL